MSVQRQNKKKKKTCPSWSLIPPFMTADWNWGIGDRTRTQLIVRFLLAGGWDRRKLTWSIRAGCKPRRDTGVEVVGCFRVGMGLGKNRY